MNQELIDFNYFKTNQLHQFNEQTGQLDVIKRNNQGDYTDKLIFIDVGSPNDDGYVRVWCNSTLRMKHRLVYFLVHGEVPEQGEEIDHIDNVRWNNCPDNLRKITKAENNKGCSNRKFGKQLTEEQVHLICKLLSDTKLSDLVIANKVGRSRCTVRDIKTRRTRTKVSKDYSWEHRGY